MASDKVQHNPTSHMLQVKKKREEQNLKKSQVAKRETCQTLMQAAFIEVDRNIKKEH